MVIFPFSAVVGNESLKMALLLSVIDPKIGGVLIKGARGSAKSTLARAVADIASIEAEQFVLLPLGADEERLVGSIDLEVVLKDGKVSFKPGLLHQAHQGILYVDEVNLLSDPLVDLLLDVCASGINCIERDGVSTSHPARFVLVGTMNPDEGELRPQLLDRFGLCVQLDDELDVAQRMQVVERRIAFDNNPDAFEQQYRDQQQHLIRSVQRAQQQIVSVNISEDCQRYACQICYQERVEGVRADITLRRAAVAYAAWQGFSEVNHDCIDKVAEFVLNHRRQANNNSVSDATESTADNNSASSMAKDSQADLNNSSTSSKQSSGDWGQMPALNVPVGDARDVDAVLPVTNSRGSAKKKAPTSQSW